VHYSNLLWVLLDLIPVIWHGALLRIPVMRSGSKFANNYRGAPIIGSWSSPQQTSVLLFHAYFSPGTVMRGTQNTVS
jgi:uncharacterized membrane protein